MSGVKRIVLADSKGLEVPTNEEIREEGTGSYSEEDGKEAKKEEKE